MTKNKPVLYYAITRCSTLEQKKKGVSHDYQKASILQYGNSLNWTCKGIFSDTMTGTDFTGRTELEKAYQLCRGLDSNIKYILVQKWDRFGRNVQGTFEWIEKFKSVGVEVNAVEQWVDMSSDIVNMMVALWSGIAADESKKNSNRTKDGNHRTLIMGYWIASCPLGYVRSNKLDHNNKKILIPCLETSDFVRTSFEKISTGKYTIAALYKKMKQAGFKTSRTRFYSMFRNNFYIGEYNVKAYKNYPAKTVTGKHIPLISISLFKKVQIVMDDLGKKHIQRNEPRLTPKSEMYHLKDSIHCFQCAKNLTAHGSKGKKGTIYHYYSCTKKGHYRIGIKAAHDLINKLLGEFVLNQESYETLFNQVKVQLDKERKGKVKNLELTRGQLEKSKQGLLNVKTQFMQNNIDADDYKDLKAMSLKSISIAESDIESLESELMHQDDILLKVLERMKDVRSIYVKGDAIEKKAVLKSLFPVGFSINKESMKVRTPFLNSFVSQLFSKSSDYEFLEIKNGTLLQDVPFRVQSGTLLEHSKENHLNLLKLLLND